MRRDFAGKGVFMIEQRKDFIINIVYYAIILGLMFIAIKFSVKYLMPFIIGFIIAFLLKPIVHKLTHKFGQRKYISLLVISLFYIVIGTFIVWIFFAALSGIQSLTKQLPVFYEEVMKPGFADLTQWSTGILSTFDPKVAEFVQQFLDTSITALGNFAQNISGSVINFLTKLVTSVPSLLISILIAIISSFFFTLDYRKIVNQSLDVLPEDKKDLVLDVKVVGNYFKAYLTLMSLTFVELSVAFLVLRIPNAIGIALIIASVDILPVLGTGSVMLPWSIYEMISGDSSRGVALFVIYIVITVIRNILEPKVVGKQIGLHPLLTLVCIYVGLKLFGFIGLLGLPIAVTLIKSLHDEGKITFFKKKII